MKKAVADQSGVLGKGRQLSYATGPKLRDAVIDDYERIVSLASRHQMPLEPFEYWKKLWLTNPAYTDKTPIGWVLDHDNEIVGWFANVPLHYYLCGDLLRAATPRSWVVDEPFRSHAVLLADAFFSQKDMDLAISTTGNEKSTPAFAALGGIPVPQSLKREAAFWITDYAGFSAAYLRWKKLPQPEVLKYPLVGALALRHMVSGSEPRGRSAERRSQFDCEYDNFWSQLKRSAKILIGRRDAAALNWHFGNALQSGGAWLFDCRTGSRVTAYGVFLRYDHHDIGLKRTVLADYQGDEGESQLPQILKAALIQARHERIHTVEISGSRLEQSDLVQKLAPHKRVMLDRSMAYQYKAFNHWEQLLADEARWDITIFDGDSSLSPILI
jgi:hypothetical protein